MIGGVRGLVRSAITDARKRTRGGAGVQEKAFVLTWSRIYYSSCPRPNVTLFVLCSFVVFAWVPLCSLGYSAGWAPHYTDVGITEQVLLKELFFSFSFFPRIIITFSR